MSNVVSHHCRMCNTYASPDLYELKFHMAQCVASYHERSRACPCCQDQVQHADPVSLFKHMESAGCYRPFGSIHGNGNQSSVFSAHGRNTVSVSDGRSSFSNNTVPASVAVRDQSSMTVGGAVSAITSVEDIQKQHSPTSNKSLAILLPSGFSLSFPSSTELLRVQALDKDEIQNLALSFKVHSG